MILTSWLAESSLPIPIFAFFFGSPLTFSVSLVNSTYLYLFPPP